MKLMLEEIQMDVFVCDYIIVCGCHQFNWLGLLGLFILSLQSFRMENGTVLHLALLKKLSIRNFKDNYEQRFAKFKKHHSCQSDKKYLIDPNQFRKYSDIQEYQTVRKHFSAEKIRQGRKSPIKRFTLDEEEKICGWSMESEMIKSNYKKEIKTHKIKSKQPHAPKIDILCSYNELKEINRRMNQQPLNNRQILQESLNDDQKEIMNMMKQRDRLKERQKHQKIVMRQKRSSTRSRNKQNQVKGFRITSAPQYDDLFFDNFDKCQKESGIPQFSQIKFYSNILSK